MPRLLLPIGGLGSSQLNPQGFLWWKKPGLIDALRSCYTVANIGGWNEFSNTSLIAQWIASQDPVASLTIIGHSLGVDSAIHSKIITPVRQILLVLIAPVWGQKPKPNCPALVIQPSSSIFPKAEVAGITSQTIAGTDHNSVCHDERTFDLVRKFLESALS